MTMLALNKPVDLAVLVATGAAARILGETAANQHRGQRAGVWIQPEGTVAIGGSAVTFATGLKLVADQLVFVEWKSGAEWYVITGGGNVNLRRLSVLE